MPMSRFGRVDPGFFGHGSPPAAGTFGAGLCRRGLLQDIVLDERIVDPGDDLGEVCEALAPVSS